MPSVSFLRHAGWFGPEDVTEPLHIIGVGATGSYIGLIAAKMGFHSFKIWDPDIVEDHNLPNQIYDVEHIGERKVIAFQKVLQRFNPMIKVEAYDEYFASDSKDSIEGPLVLTVDTMSARKEIYDAFRLNWKVKNVFETRLGFDYGEINIIKNMDLAVLEEWKSTLRDDSEIPEGPCNMRICTTLVNLAASLTVHSICSMLSAQRQNREWEYSKKTIFSTNPQFSSYNISE